MKKKIFRVTSMILAMTLLAACSRGSDDTIEDYSRKGIFALLLPQESEEDKDSTHDIDWNAYMLSAGMDYAQDTINAVFDQQTTLSLQSQTWQTLQDQESCQLLSVPLTGETLTQVVDATGYNDEMAKYIPLYQYFRSLQVNNTEQLDPSGEESAEATRLYLVHLAGAIAAPASKTENQIMLLLYGNRDTANTGVYIVFENVADGIMSVRTGMLWADLIEDLRETFPQWFETGTWYSQEEIMEAQQRAEGVSRSIEPESVGDVNQYLINTARQLNNVFINTLEDELGDELAGLSAGGGDDADPVVHLIPDCKSFDLAAVVTTENAADFPDGRAAYFCTDAGYSVVEYGALSWLCPKLYMPMPEEWTSDVTVLLGSAAAQHFAMVHFYNISDPQAQEDEGMYISYSFGALPEGQSFANIQEFFSTYKAEHEIDTAVTYASPYGVWDSVDGFQNLYAVN